MVNLLILILILLVPVASAQDLGDLEPVIEALADTDELDEHDRLTLVEDLMRLAEDPLDLNTATVEDLNRLPFLDPVLTGRIVAFRERFNGFEVLSELMAIEGFTATLYDLIKPFVYIKPVNRTTRTTRATRATRPQRGTLIQRFTRRLDLGRGYIGPPEERPYQGSPPALLTRLRGQLPGNVTYALTAEKDAGETTYPPDYRSGHLALRDRGRLATLIVGDFSAAFGQGLVLWNGRGFGKSPSAVRPLLRRGSGLRPYGSSEENRFFRGLGVSVDLATSLRTTLLLSRRRFDGFGSTGLHRTQSERERENSVGETLIGINLAYTRPGLNLGATGYRALFDTVFSAGTRPDQRFAFSGTQTQMAGLYATIRREQITGFAEVALSPDRGLGSVGGVHLRLSESVEVLSLLRHYPARFISLYGAGFGERNGATQNETGLYFGLRLRLRSYGTLSAYFDQFAFPWLRYAVARPTRGHEGVAALDLKPRPRFRLSLTYKHEAKEQPARLQNERGLTVAGVAPHLRQSLRGQIELVPTPSLRLRIRLEGTRYHEPDTTPQTGFLVYQDVRLRPTTRLRLYARLAFFDVEGGDARIYAFENDLLYALRTPSFSGIGERMYGLLHYTFGRFDVWLKYAVTRYAYATHVGSGYEEVSGNRIREIRTQLRIRF